MTPTQSTIVSALTHFGAENGGFFGILSFHFQNGRLALVRREQTLLPEELTVEKELPIE